MSENEIVPVRLESWSKINDDGEFRSVEFSVMQYDGHEIIAMTEAAYLLMFQGIDTEESDDRWLMVYASVVSEAMEGAGYQCVISEVNE